MVIGLEDNLGYVSTFGVSMITKYISYLQPVQINDIEYHMV